MTQIEIGLAGRHDAEPRRPGIQHDAVETIGAGEGRDRFHLGAVQSPLGLQRRIGPADREAARRHLEIVGRDDLDAIDVADDRSGALDRFRDRLEADPTSRETRQRESQNAEIEIVLQRRRIDHRHQRRGKHLLALMRQRRGLAAMVVAGKRNDAAILRTSRRVRVLERIERAVDSRTLAVPDAEHAIDLGAGEHANLLAAPHGGRGEVLVETGDEGDVMLLQERLCAPQRVVIHAERRAAIAGNETRGVQPRRAIALSLQHRQPDQGLRSRQKDPLRIQPVLVVQPNFQQCHDEPCPHSLRPLLGPDFVGAQHALVWPCMHSPLYAAPWHIWGAFSRNLPQQQYKTRRRPREALTMEAFAAELAEAMVRGTHPGWPKLKEVLMTRVRVVVALFVGLISSTDVEAKCSCQCVNGRMQSVCTSPGDLLPANCPMTACTMTGPTVLPIQPPQPPPPGTSVCSQQQGRRICR